MAALVGCEEDMGTEDWLIVDNRTDSKVFITDAGTDLRNSMRGNETTGFDILGRIGAESQERSTKWTPREVMGMTAFSLSAA
jgi:hypothetical protein